MVKMFYSRNDIETLANRLSERASSILLFDQPMLCRDLKSAARVLRFMLAQGMPVTGFEIDSENGNG